MKIKLNEEEINAFVYKYKEIMGTDLIIFLTKKTQNVIKYECIKRKK